MAVLTFKNRTAPQHRHTSVVTSRLESVNRHFARPPYVPLLDKPFAVRQDRLRETSLSLFCANCLDVWNSLPGTIISAGSLSVFKSRLKTYFFRARSADDSVSCLTPHKRTTCMCVIGQYLRCCRLGHY